MSANSKIEWTDHTFNPWEGCTKVSPGCVNCYAETLVDKRYGRAKWGKGNPRRRTSPQNWKLPLKWNREASEAERIAIAGGIIDSEFYERPRVFCASLADWLDDEVPIEWLADLLKLIHDTPNLDWLLLTKRPELWLSRIEQTMLLDSTEQPLYNWLNSWVCSAHGFVSGNYKSTPPHNIWLGTSVEDQIRADERIPLLLQTPAAIRFLSCEPLIGPLNLTEAGYFRDANTEPEGGWFGSKLSAIDWVIIGGESGPKARPCKLDWIRDIVAQCKTADVATFVKQLGSRPRFDDARDSESLRTIFHGKGGDISEWPADLRVREFPQPSTINHQPSP